ncbi:mycothiol synthase [Micromonospora polyrhachis]|uniref:Mycothiol acetyltransferase n=1 Tax=Micromonospora polyrhachis TaxID=1282883 RepID=A0A7W7WQ45_9ACTN|nr:mycothiol synthase [Micromonospora polyrhachis]MBB4959645.1 mycothiol synthase [Micromonospora polyrhachis]
MTSRAAVTSVQVGIVGELTEDLVREVLALAEAAAVTDGANPFSEHTLLRIRQGHGTHLLIHGPDDQLTGYAHLEPASTDEPTTPSDDKPTSSAEAVGTGDATAELVVHPARRRRGLGRALVTATAAHAGGPLYVWAHGDHPSAAALALDLGFERVRVLWQMRLPLSTPLPEPRLAAGMSIRAFRPGVDDEAWVAVNRRAFASHPEQGRWTLADLHARMAEPWFDPAGFLVATEDATGRLLGFHWTKVHAGDGSVPIGEVYVVGVEPDAHGLGLGRALTTAGLRHLRDQGLTRAMLYVDESNTSAVRLYSRLGFARRSIDVGYRRA